MSKTVSVITTTYEDLGHLKEVAESLLLQDYESVEYVVVDGGSKDGTLEYLKDFQKEIANKPGWRFTYISEKDEGIYDAINKGLRLATGDIIGPLFDRFAKKDVLSRIVRSMEEEGTDGVHGNLDYMDEKGNTVRKWRMGDRQDIRSGWMPAHPTLYLKRKIYDIYGGYKTDYRIAADYEFMVRILEDKKVKLSYIPDVLIHMYYGGTSTAGAGSYWESFWESVRALKENGISHPILICLKRTLKVFGQFQWRKQ
ncbi:MAG: glycosyltransferase [Lachnospiraceae bacterium]|nr:glycosyltransferase [Lachnospiraceae bacterium]